MSLIESKATERLDPTHTPKILSKFLAELRLLCREIVDVQTRHWEAFDALSTHIQHDYEGRFAVELIQNAEDANAEEGAVQFLFDTQADLPTVYVANTGIPFTDSNFRAICNLALSDKDPSKNIGNKGLGFRSVLEITSTPTVYSRSRDSANALGYCFEFTTRTRTIVRATLDEFAQSDSVHSDYLSAIFSTPVELLGEDDPNPDRLRRAIRSQPELLDEIQRKLYPYMFPLPAPRPDEHVQDFLEAGYASVIVLPLDRPRSFETALERIEQLGEYHLLFLHKLRSLEVRILGSETTTRRVFERREDEELPADCRVLCQLDPDHEREHQTAVFRVGETSIAGEELAASQSDLGPRWNPLSEANVSVAVQVSGTNDRQEGLFSIGLPTEMPTSSGVWVDAPFYGDISRKHIDFKKPFNQLLLKTAARAIPGFLEKLDPASNIDGSTAALSVLDFDSSDAPLAKLLLPSDDDDAVDSANQASEIQLLPLVQGKSSAVSGPEVLRLGQVRLVPSVSSCNGFSWLNGERLAPYLALPDDRYLAEDDGESRLIRVAKAFGGARAPRLDELAEILEKLVAALVADVQGKRASMDELKQLYGDLNQIYRSEEQRKLLIGRKLVVDHESTLRSTQNSNPAVFEPPQMTQEASDLAGLIDSIPKVLKRKIVFVHGETIEQRPAREGLSPSLQLLRGSKPPFIETFDTRGLVNTALKPVSLPGRLDDATGRELLRWAFQLRQVTRNQASSDDVEWPAICVPVHAGDSQQTKWVRARHAYFSRGWLGETGQLLEEALPTQDSHGKPRNFLLRPQEFLSLVGGPPSLASGEDVLGAWQSFLRSVMRVHQSPRVLVSSAEGTRSRRDAFRCYGSYHRLKPHQGLKNVADLPADAWAAFLDQLSAMKEGSMIGWGLVQEWKTYEVNRYVSIDGFTQITAATSTAYAQLIGANPETYRRWMKCTIRRVDRPSDTETTIPSTLAALFMTSNWLPCDRHGVDTVVALPSDVLLIDPADLSRSEAAAKPHDFLPHLPRHVAGKPGTAALRQLVNLTALDDVDLKAGAKWLAWLQDHTDEHIHSGLRGLWYDMLDRVAKAAANTEAPKSHLDDQCSWDRLLVEAPVGDGRSQVTLWKPAVDEADGQGPVFLPDQPALANQLTGFLRIVACGSYTTDILRLLQWRFGSEAVRPISEVGLRPAADDVDLNAISVDTLPLLREENHGLVRAILAVLAFGRTDRMNLERDPFQAYRRNLMQLRYLTVQGLKVSVTEASNKAIPQPAFVWEDKRCLLVDAGHRRQLKSLLDALGPFLNARDLAQWGYYHLSDLFPDGLDSCSEMARIEEYLQHRFADRTMLEQLQRRLEADETWVVNRLIPALLSIVPNSAVDEEDVVNRFRKTYATAKSEDAIKATWRELYTNEPFPTGFNDLYWLAVSEAPIDRVAHRAFELWGVTLRDWNVKAAKYCPNLAGLRNPNASAIVLAATEKLLPSARALLRRHLTEEKRRQNYLVRADALEAEHPCPDAVSDTWTPSPQDIARPLAEALAGVGEGELLPGWTSQVLPRSEEGIEDVPVRLAAAGLDIRDDEDDRFENNVNYLLPILDFVQNVALAKWKQSKGDAQPPESLYTRQPRQSLKAEYRAALDSSLCFEALNESSAFVWVRAWWTCLELNESFEPLPPCPSHTALQETWEIADEELDNARQIREELRKGIVRKRRTLRLLNDEFEMPDDDTYRGLREFIDERLNPEFGASLDPSEPSKLLKPGAGSGGGGGGSDSGDRTPHRVTRQDEFVGAVGEYFVYRALKKLSGGRIASNAWRSENRQHFIDDDKDGDDSLGFDFSFQLAGQRYEVEVKTTTSRSPSQVQLGPTEVRAAQKAARKKRGATWQLWIVSDALSSPAIHILGNPYVQSEDFHVDALGALVRFQLSRAR